MFASLIGAGVIKLEENLLNIWRDATYGMSSQPVYLAKLVDIGWTILDALLGLRTSVDIEKMVNKCVCAF